MRLVPCKIEYFSRAKGFGETREELIGRKHIEVQLANYLSTICFCP